jgi:hypothetical protein
MPILPNHKHELFAQGLAKGLSADAAYQAAGYKRDRGNAARLMKGFTTFVPSDTIASGQPPDAMGRAAMTSRQ